MTQSRWLNGENITANTKIQLQMEPHIIIIFLRFKHSDINAVGSWENWKKLLIFARKCISHTNLNFYLFWISVFSQKIMEPIYFYVKYRIACVINLDLNSKDFYIFPWNRLIWRVYLPPTLLYFQLATTKFLLFLST